MNALRPWLFAMLLFQGHFQVLHHVLSPEGGVSRGAGPSNLPYGFLCSPLVSDRFPIVYYGLDSKKR